MSSLRSHSHKMQKCFYGRSRRGISYWTEFSDTHKDKKFGSCCHATMTRQSGCTTFGSDSAPITTTWGFLRFPGNLMLAKTSAASPGHVLRSLCGCGSMSILAFCPFFPPSLQSLHSAPFPPSLQSSVSSRRNGNACAMQCNRHNSADLSRKEREQTISLCSGPQNKQAKPTTAKRGGGSSTHQSARTRQDKRRNAGGPIATSPHETTALRMSGLRLLTTPTRTTPCPVKSPPCRRAALTAANHETLPPEPCHRHGATARHLPRRPCPASSSNSSARPAAQEARNDPSTRRPAGQPHLLRRPPAPQLRRPAHSASATAWPR